MKQKVAMDVLAQQLALEKNHDMAAAHYLANLGITPLSKPIDDTALSRLAEPDITAHTLASPRLFSPRKQAFDFSFLTVDSREPLNDDNESLKPNSARFKAEDDAGQGIAPPKPELEPLRPLLTRLLLALKQGKPGHKLAIKPLIKQIAKQQIVARLPVLPISHDPHQLLIYLDISSALSGLAADGFAVAKALVQSLPQCEVKIIVLPDGPQGRWAYLGDPQQQPGSLVLPDSGSACLIITGLAEGIEQWRFLLAGLAARAITPCWLSASKTSVPGHHITTWGQGHSSTKIQQPLKVLLALLSTCRIITGAMLRQVIQHLGLAAHYETAFWQQPHVYYQAGADTGYINQEHNTFDDAFEQFTELEFEVLANIIEQHLKPIGTTVLHEHRMHLSIKTTKWSHPQLTESIEFFSQLGGSIQGDDDHSHNIAQYLVTTIQQYQGLLKDTDSKVKQTLALACAYNYQQNISHNIPDELAEQVQQLIKQNKPSQTEQIQLTQRSNQLIWQTTDDNSTVSTPLLLKTKHSTAAPLLVRDDNSIQILTPNKAYQTNKATTLTIQSTTEKLQLTARKLTDFYWAKSLSVTAKGVVACTEHIRVSWPENNDNGAIIEVLDHAPQWLHQHAPELDKHGLYVDIAVKDVTFRLRYIPPGSFLMGSPDDEAEREENEIQHPVTLTQGYWLGETTVTQALWQAVMGNNPSHFKGSELLPVEQVIWDDCQKFCQQLNKLLPGMSLSLPTEAQWEYACRAGSQTPFSTGEQLTAEQANYDGENPYNQGKKGKYREKTIEVSSFECSAWGLKQMHGNVLEWCQNGWGKYSQEAQVDPVGDPDSELRPLRGGGWFSLGRGCRSACRDAIRRGDADSGVGLRVTQVLSEKERAASAAPTRSGARAVKEAVSETSESGFGAKLFNWIKDKQSGKN